jgi:glycosyltransferase involved in cell wall biosynthesis
MPPINVSIVLPDGLGGKGGIARIITYLMREIEAHHPDIRVSAHATRLTERKLLNHASVPIGLAAFALACARGRIDVAHINVAPRGSTWRKGLYVAVARAFGKPVILHLHGSGYNEFYAGLSQQKQSAVRNLFGKAQHVVALSAFWSAFVRDALKIAPDHIAEIPNGVPAVPGAAPRAVGDGPPRIVFLGILGQRKGVDVLIDALAKVAGEGLAWQAVLGGNGEVAAAQEQAQRLGIADRISFPGWVGEEEVHRYLSDGDIFVLPSRAENQPVAILEAMARARPVIATRIGAIPEQVADGETGLLVEPGDVDSLAAALRTLIADAPRRSAMGAAGLDRFARFFSVESCASRFADLYRSSVAKR